MLTFAWFILCCLILISFLIVLLAQVGELGDGKSYVFEQVAGKLVVARFPFCLAWKRVYLIGVYFSLAREG
jgi:hypothetical protein